MSKRVRFIQQVPEVNVRVVDGAVGEVIQMMEDGMVMVLFSDPATHLGDSETLIQIVSISSLEIIEEE